MIYRNLEKIRGIIDEATGLEVSYAYEDLVFPDHTAFIIQYDDTNENNLFCYFHNDCNKEDEEGIYSALQIACKNVSTTILSKGSFTLGQKEEQVEIKFL
ncbi:hypothetical protein OAA06_01750 [bacterium]|nr:hypothetical protein [bacterium]